MTPQEQKYLEDKYKQRAAEIWRDGRSSTALMVMI